MVIVLVVLAAIYMGWSMGANDAANCVGATIGSGVMSVRTGIIITCLFSFLGATLIGGNVINTIGKGVIDMGSIPLYEKTLLAFAALFSAAIWTTLATYKKVPVSTSHAIVGAVAGGGILLSTTLYFQKITQIFICWILTPLGSCILTIFLYRLFIIFFMFKPIKRYRRLIMFILIYLTSAYLAFSWGANDVANATGVLVALDFKSSHAAIIGASAIIFGVVTWGYRVIETVGFKIARITPVMTVVIGIATALNVHIYTRFGIPVSTSHSIIGAVWGAGIVKGIKTMNLRLAREIMVTWAITPVVAGIITYITLGIILVLTKQ